MTKTILTAGLLLLFCTKAFCQKTPADFGAMAFYCFQNNKMDSLFRFIPTLAETAIFAKELGIVEGTAAYTAFVNRYPLVIKSFRDKCYQIEADSGFYKFSWKKAQMGEIEITEKSMHTNSTPPKEIQMTVVNINFSSGSQKFQLQFGDLHQYGNGWKAGNNLTLSIKYD